MKKLILTLISVTVVVMLFCGFTAPDTTDMLTFTAPARPASEDCSHALDSWEKAMDEWFAESHEIPNRVEDFVDELSRAVDEV
ncbi:MAG: hypothetical protein ACOX81_07765 [Candidatus Heteroscillospira sp.]